MNIRTLVLLIVSCCLAVGSLLLPTISYAGNDVPGEIQLQGATKVEKTSDVWIDGQYVGYLKELKGSKKILLLPGEHEIVVRQAGYKDFAQKVVVRPGEKQVIRVAMEKDLRMPLPTVTAKIKLSVVSDRAAVFVDGLFAGHVAEFGGIGRALPVAPGKRRSRSVWPATKLLKQRSRSWPIRNSKSRRNWPRAAFRQLPHRIRNNKCRRCQALHALQCAARRSQRQVIVVSDQRKAALIDAAAIATSLPLKNMHWLRHWTWLRIGFERHPWAALDFVVAP